MRFVPLRSQSNIYVDKGARIEGNIVEKFDEIDSLCDTQLSRVVRGRFLPSLMVLNLFVVRDDQDILCQKVYLGGGNNFTVRIAFPVFYVHNDNCMVFYRRGFSESV